MDGGAAAAAVGDATSEQSAVKPADPLSEMSELATSYLAGVDFDELLPLPPGLVLGLDHMFYHQQPMNNIYKNMNHHYLRLQDYQTMDHRLKEDATKSKKKPAAADVPEYTPLGGVGKNAVSHLQEYCINVLKTPPKYTVTTQEDPRHPFVTHVLVNGEVVGRGEFSNKKASKRLAAENALKKLCPAVYAQCKQEDEDQEEKSDAAAPLVVDNVDDIRTWSVEDERLSKIAVSAKTPLQLFYEYCSRHHLQPNWTEVPQAGSGHDIKCMVAAHDGRLLSQSIAARMKKEGKQRVSQKLLQLIYPQARTWGDMVDLVVSRHRESDDKLTSTLAFIERLKADIVKTKNVTTLEASPYAHLLPPTLVARPPHPLPTMYSTATTSSTPKNDFAMSSIRIAVNYISALQNALGSTEVDRRRSPSRDASPVRANKYAASHHLNSSRSPPPPPLERERERDRRLPSEYDHIQWHEAPPLVGVNFPPPPPILPPPPPAAASSSWSDPRDRYAQQDPDWTKKQRRRMSPTRPSPPPLGRRPY